MNPRELISTIDSIFLSNRAEEKIFNKCDSDDYFKWKETISNRVIEEKEILSETSGLNLAFTYFQNLTQKSESVIFSDLFYVHKSYLGPYATLYLKSRILRNIGAEKRLKYSYQIMFEPIGKLKYYALKVHRLVKHE
jgi:hypothetical protein